MSHLCSNCVAILDRVSIAIAGGHYIHHQQFSDFKQAVDEKCYICVRLWKRIYKTEPDMLALQPSTNVPYVDIIYSIRKWTSPESIDIWFIEGGPKPAKGPPTLPFFTAIPSKSEESGSHPVIQEADSNTLNIS